jgi:hypothetical protein
MAEIDHNLAIEALRVTGEALTEDIGPGSASARVVLAGGVAGMLTGALAPDRTTTDCDVIDEAPEGVWEQLQRAAAHAAEQLGLPDNWLRHDCRMFASRLPLRWRDRLVPIGRFGSLEVKALNPRDLFCLKLTSARRRPQDRQDLRDMRPTGEWLAFARRHLDRLEEEDVLQLEDLAWERAFLDELGESNDEAQ